MAENNLLLMKKKYNMIIFRFLILRDTSMKNIHMFLTIFRGYENEEEQEFQLVLNSVNQ